MTVRERLELDVSGARTAIASLSKELGSAGSKFNRELNGSSRSLSGTNQAMGQVAAQTRAATTEATKFHGALGSIRAVAGGIGVAFAGASVIQFFRGAITEADEAQRTIAQTEAVIRSTGGAAGVSAQHVADLADRLSKVAAVDDEVIAGGANMLLTFKQIKGANFDAAVQSTLDLAAAMAASSGGALDLQSSAIRLGKALNDPVKGLTALNRVGIQFTAQQKQQITAFVEAGDVAKAQGVILREVQSQFGGSAAAQATDVKRMQVAWKDFQEDIGAQITPALFALFEATRELLPPIADLTGVLVSGLVPIIQALAPVIQIVADALSSVPPEMIAAAGAALILSRNIGTMMGLLDRFGGKFRLAFAQQAQVTQFSDKLAKVGIAATAAVAGASILAPAFQDLGASAGEANALASGLSGAVAGFAVGGPVGAAIGGVAGLAAGLLGLGGAAEDTGASIEELSAKSDRALLRLAENLAAIGGAEFAGTSIDATAIALEKLNMVAAESPGVAERLGQAFVAAGLITEEQFNKAIEKGASALARMQQDGDRTNKIVAGFKDAVGGSAAKVDEFAQAVQRFADSAVSQLPTAAQAFDDTKGALEGFGLSLSSAISPEAFNAALQESIAAIANFPATVQALIDAGLTNVAALVVQKGPELGGAFGQAVLAATPAIQQSMNANLGTLQTKTGEMTAYLQGPFRSQANSAWLLGIGGIPPSTAQVLGQAAGAVQAGGGQVAGQAQVAGGQGAAGFGSGIAPLPGLAGTAVGAAAGAVSSAAGGLSNPAYAAGASVGAAFGDGVMGGIASRISGIAAEARQAVQTAIQAAKDEAQAASPSKRAQHEIGVPLGQGIALGLRSTKHIVAEGAKASLSGAFDMGRLGTSFAAAVARHQSGPSVTVIKVGSRDELFALLPRSVTADPAFLEVV